MANYTGSVIQNARPFGDMPISIAALETHIHKLRCECDIAADELTQDRFVYTATCASTEHAAKMRWI